MTTAKRLAEIEAWKDIGCPIVSTTDNQTIYVPKLLFDIKLLLDLIAERDAEIKRLRMAAAEALHHIADAAPGEAYLTLQNIGEP